MCTLKQKNETLKTSIMKYIKLVTFVTLVYTGAFIASCKGKNKTDTVDTTINNTQQTVDTTGMQPAPVQVSPDDSLTMMAKDAVKDYPGVTATVSNGEVTLTGDITREKLPKLMQAVTAMHPKKINNNLTIK